jgi:transketolase
MRGAFFRALVDLAEREPRVTLIVGDLGFGVVEEFVRRFPDRFLNAGVAEQNMTGIAAGMALSGKIVFTYSIANFPILRCLEQVRNDVCYHNADVKIVAIGGGLAYGSLGMTHHATEDLAIMRSLPRIAVIAPGDPIEAEAATRAVAAHPGPCYLRLGRAGESNVHARQISFRIGKAIQICDGKDLTLISTGGMLETAARVSELLQRNGVGARLLSMHTVKPLDADAVLEAARATGAIFTLEEHSVIGGLGSAVAEILAENRESLITFKRLGLSTDFSSVIGTQEYLRAHHGLSVESLAATIRSTLEKDRSLTAAATATD